MSSPGPCSCPAELTFSEIRGTSRGCKSLLSALLAPASPCERGIPAALPQLTAQQHWCHWCLRTADSTAPPSCSRQDQGPETRSSSDFTDSVLHTSTRCILRQEQKIPGPRQGCTQIPARAHWGQGVHSQSLRLANSHLPLTLASFLLLSSGGPQHCSHCASAGAAPCPARPAAQLSPGAEPHGGIAAQTALPWQQGDRAGTARHPRDSRTPWGLQHPLQHSPARGSTGTQHEHIWGINTWQTRKERGKDQLIVAKD